MGGEERGVGKGNLPSSAFLTWFIGFTEGDGSFVVSKRGDLSFVIVQDTRDIQILYMIQKTFPLSLSYSNIYL